MWEDVTRHNCSLPPLAVKSPERLGLLHRLDTSRDAWVQHYCILKDGCLSLYSGIRATHAQGTVPDGDGKSLASKSWLQTGERRGTGRAT